MLVPKQITKFASYPEVVYKEYKAPTHLQPYTHYMWNLHSDNSQNFRYTIIPDGCVDVILEKTTEGFINPIVAMPYTKTIEISFDQTFNYWGIRFKTGQILNFLDIPFQEITQGFVPLHEFASFPKSFESFTEFLTFFSLLHNNSQAIQQFLREFKLDPFLLENYYISNRHKRRISQIVAGMSLRDFKNIVRFQSVIQNPNRAMQVFYDQSHTIRSFKSITGKTPTQFFQHFSL